MVPDHTVGIDDTSGTVSITIDRRYERGPYLVTTIRPDVASPTMRGDQGPRLTTYLTRYDERCGTVSCINNCIDDTERDRGLSPTSDRTMRNSGPRQKIERIFRPVKAGLACNKATLSKRQINVTKTWSHQEVGFSLLKNAFASIFFHTIKSWNTASVRVGAPFIVPVIMPVACEQN